MAAVHDGEAICEDRLLSSHRGALEVFRNQVIPLHPDSITWLDIGCGRGQILRHVPEVMGKHQLDRLLYVGCDGNDDYCRQTRAMAVQHGLQRFDVRQLRIENLGSEIADVAADFVSVINVVHELNPATLATALCSAVTALAENGVLHVRDVVSLSKAGINSVCWTAEDMRDALQPLFDLFEWSADDQRVINWGPDWSFELCAANLSVDPDEFANQHGAVAEGIERRLMARLSPKMGKHDKDLRHFSKWVPQNETERRIVAQAVYEHWTIGTWLEAHK